MRIILVVAESGGKNLVFAADTLRAYSLDESVQLAEQGKLESLHTVKTGQGAYLRANPNASEKDNLDHLSVSAFTLYTAIDDIKSLLSKPGGKLYWEHLKNEWQSIEEEGEHVIYIEGYPRITKDQVIEKLTPHRQLIRTAAGEFSVDPYTLGSVIVDEVARVHNWEEITDKLGAVFVGINTSAGIAQVTMDTAKDLIERGYYNPNPNDKKLSRERIRKTPRAHVYAYVVQPKHNVRFAAARIRYLIDRWKPFVDISKRVEIIGTLYSLPDSKAPPHPHPVSNGRGLQISQEFYPLARSIIQ